MISSPLLKRLKLLYCMAANSFLLRVTTTAVVVAILLQATQGVALVNELLSQLYSLRPIYLVLVMVLATTATTINLIRRPRTIYLLDYACFHPRSTVRIPKAAFLEHAHLSPFLTDSTVNFIARVLELSGMGEETNLPNAYHYIEPYCCLDEARAMAELVAFSVIDDLLAKTCISPHAIDVLITNCAIFCPMPSIADVIVNRYKLRGDIRTVNLSGMGCSAGVTAIGLAGNILQVTTWGSHALVVSVENVGPNYYGGNKRAMQVPNILFRMGGSAKLLSTKRSKARFQLAHLIRTINATNEAYMCVYEEEDEEGNQGFNLSKDLMTIAEEALKANITAIGPLVLPTSELLKFFIFPTARKVLQGKIRSYIPDFHLAFQHFCIHVGGPAVINSVQDGLNLSDDDVEPSRMTLHRFGNQASVSVWYELAYIEAKGRMRKDDKVWMIGFGAGYKCNTAVWVCIDPSSSTYGPWASCIHRYPVDISKK